MKDDLLSRITVCIEREPGRIPTWSRAEQILTEVMKRIVEDGYQARVHECKGCRSWLSEIERELL